MPTSKSPQTPVEPPSDDVSHVYVKQHDTRGLQPRFRGPFEVLARPSRSTLEIKVGLTKEGVVRKELRSWADCKPAFRREAVDAERPKRGRPPKKSLSQPEQLSPPENLSPQPEPPKASNNSSSARPVRSTRNQAPNYIASVAQVDFPRPPPPFMVPAATGTPPFSGFHQPAWSASASDLNIINQSIAGSPVRCEARG